MTRAAGPLDTAIDQLAEPLTAVFVALGLIIVAATVYSRLGKFLLFVAAVATLVWMGVKHTSTGRPLSTVFSGITGDSVVAFLERPLVGLAAGILLAFLGSQAGWRFMKLLAFCGALAALIWAAIRYAAVGNAVTTGFQVIGTVLVWLIIAVTIIIVVVIVATLVMSITSPSPRVRHSGFVHHNPGFSAESLEGTRIERFEELSRRLTVVLEASSPDGADSLGPIVRYYFSGLGDVREEIAEIRERVDWEIHELADAAPEEYPLLKVERLRALAEARVFLPSRDEWAAFSREVFDMRVPYLALRLLLLRRDWREVATVFYKCHFCAQMLAEY